MKDPKSVLTIKEVAKYLGVHPMTVYKFANQGKIPAFKIGSDWRFYKKYIEEWIERETFRSGKKNKTSKQNNKK